MSSITDFAPDRPTKKPRKARPSKIQDASRKWCPHCKMFVPRTQFPKNKSTKDGLFAYCQPCTIIKMRSYDYREAARGRNLVRNYGITLEDFDAMLGSQGNSCAICGGTPSGKHWHVDHDHDTGKVRGILCNGCNTALGNMRDSPAILRAAADYLERHGK